MPVIVLATSGRDVLICQGGKWLIDTYPDKDKVGNAQKLIGFPNTFKGLQDAAAEASVRAASFGPDVKFTPLEWKTNPDRYSTRFLIPSNPPGFIKGTYPDSKYPNETPEQAARREFREETGYSLEGKELIPGYKTATVFRVEIPQNEKLAIIQAWKNMGTMGELVDVRWEPISDIRKDIRLLNPESKPAVQHLPLKAGRRKTRRKNGSKKAHKKTRK